MFNKPVKFIAQVALTQRRKRNIRYEIWQVH